MSSCLRECSARPGRGTGGLRADHPESPQRLLDVREVGRMLGCSWRTVYRLADEGKSFTG